MRIVRQHKLVNKIGAQEIQIEPGAKVILVEGDRHGKNFVHVWFECDSDERPCETRSFRVVRTDVQFPDGHIHVGSTVGNDGRFVHVYEEISNQKQVSEKLSPEGN